VIVYGDAQYEEAAGTLLAQLRARLEQLLPSCLTAPPSLDALRTLLIQAGQLEQAAHDAAPSPRFARVAGAGEPRFRDREGFPRSRRRGPVPGRLRSPPPHALRDTPPWLTRIASVTDCAAAAFYSRWAADSREAPSPPPRRDPDPAVVGALQRMACTLQQIQAPPGARLTVNLPEGFTYYALYPEQYTVSALRWVADHAPSTPGHVLVVGIRSIGTTLSAIVAAALAAAGWEARRLTVRPSGPPSDRHVELPSVAVPGAWRRRSAAILGADRG
jgi:hypothetical protein